MKRISSRAKGVTLIELLVTLAVMAILAVIAMPSLRNTIRSNQVATANNALLADLSYARTEAVNRGLIVSVCPSQDGLGCSGATTYDKGWIVYSYTPGNAVANTPYTGVATNPLLRYTQTRQGVSIQATDDSANGDVISFNSQGQQLPVKGAVEMDFVTCYRDGATGTGTSSSSVQGIELALGVAGGVSTKPWAAGATCTP